MGFWLKAERIQRQKNMDLWERYLVLHTQFNPKFHWIKGHAGHPENERCDQLAVQAAESANLKIDTTYENDEKKDQASFFPSN